MRTAVSSACGSPLHIRRYLFSITVIDLDNLLSALYYNNLEKGLPRLPLLAKNSFAGRKAFELG